MRSFCLIPSLGSWQASPSGKGHNAKYAWKHQANHLGKAAGCERVFREKISGVTADRPQLKKLMATIGQGDVLIILAVDRLSRYTTDLLVIACQ
jgi:DNA invertase Pin-like site-specific DNA recombinase